MFDGLIINFVNRTWILVAVVLLAKLGLTVSRPLGVDVDQAVILAKMGITGIGEMPVRMGLWLFQVLVTMGAVKWLSPGKKW